MGGVALRATASSRVTPECRTLWLPAQQRHERFDFGKVHDAVAIRVTEQADHGLHGVLKEVRNLCGGQNVRVDLGYVKPAGERALQQAVQIDGAKAYYLAPPEYQRVWVRWDEHVVRIFDRRWTQIELRALREPGRFSTGDRDIAPRKRGSLERGAACLPVARYPQPAEATGSGVGAVRVYPGASADPQSGRVWPLRLGGTETRASTVGVRHHRRAL